jgi:uncharacterized protein YbbK (DUF523 family)
MKLVSACLLGINCKYDGRNNANSKVICLKDLVPVCPEQLGGQPTPRPNSEITGGSGHDVIGGLAKVIEKDGNDVTSSFIKGANEVLNIAKSLDIKEAILKARSPSCGCGKIYDGTFTRKLINGDGVTTALLKKNGIMVITEEDL